MIEKLAMQQSRSITSLTPRQFVSSYYIDHGASAYTVIPVRVDLKVGTFSLLDLSFHTNRLTESLSILTPNNTSSTDGVDSNNIVINNIRLKLNEYRTIFHTTDSMQQHGIATVCVSSPSFANTLTLYTSLPSYTAFDSLVYSKPCVVDVQLYKRLNPRAKSCNWPLERITLENKRDKDSQETIMYHFDNNDDCSARMVLTEGLISNLFFVDDKNNIYTVSNTIALPGSMSKLLAIVCSILGYRIIDNFSIASINEIEGYGALLTSSTKKIQEISTFMYTDNGKTMSLECNRRKSQAIQDTVISIKNTLHTLLSGGIKEYGHLWSIHSM